MISSIVWTGLRKTRPLQKSSRNSKDAASIRLDIKVDEEILPYKIPKFLLQPIVENAVIHGLMGKKGLGKILIEGRIQDGKILISIKDNGIGIPKDKIQQILSDSIPEAPEQGKYTSIGLKNTDQRIKLNYGEEYGLHVESQEGEYTLVLVELPLIP